VVVNANQPPTCTLGVTPSSGAAPLNVTASGNCTDPENDITSEVITWGDGASANGTSGTHTYTSTGTFTVALTATDSVGNHGSAPQTVTVTVNQPPTCTLSVSPQSGPAPLPVTASGSCTDPENDILSTSLNWSDGTVSNGTSGTHTFVASGTYVVTLTATDSVGNTGKAKQTVVVGSGQNKPPSCNISATPTSGQIPLSVTISPNCTDPENDITSIMVDFGDSFYASVGPNSPISHIYARKGSFTAVVTATDVAKNVSNSSSQTIATTDTPTMFVGGSGQLKQFNQSGQSVKTLNPNQSGSITGLAFDWLDSLYATDFSADTISKFDGNGNFVNTFGSGYNCKPESIVFDNSGNAYVGETGCSHALLKFDAYGNLAAAYSVTTEVEGSDWIDLASDQCTIYYTSQGKSVFRFNACTGQQQPPFASSLTTGLAVKILPDRSVLVADKADTHPLQFQRTEYSEVHGIRRELPCIFGPRSRWQLFLGARLLQRGCPSFRHQFRQPSREVQLRIPRPIHLWPWYEGSRACDHPRRTAASFVPVSDCERRAECLV
jgi:PKD repeat protein